jgi:hypothetical protein
MFKVKYKYGTDYIVTVYGAHQKQLDQYKNTEFLMYLGNQWVWEDANDYTPIE